MMLPSIRLPVLLVEQLDHLAASQGVRRSDIIREALTTHGHAAVVERLGMLADDGQGVLIRGRPGCAKRCETIWVTVMVHLLADVPHLVETIGRMRFAEWGNDNDIDEWISITRREAGREDLPVTWVAVDDTGTALGAVALGPSDVRGRPELVPCVWGMVVRADLRRRGIGRLLLQRLEHFAVGRRYAAVWVLTGPPAVEYYERCGWRRTEQLPDGTLLRKPVPTSLGEVLPTS